MRFWRNTRVANLAANQTTTLGSGILGYEWDESPDNGFRPAGLISLSTTDADVVELPAGLRQQLRARHRHPPPDAVPGAPAARWSSAPAPIQWAWGLDDNHAGGTGTTDTAVQQATVNLFADMGAQPATLQSGLTAATASTDTTRRPRPSPPRRPGRRSPPASR